MAPLCAWMVLGMDALEPIARHVGVDLVVGNNRHGPRASDGPQVGAMVEQMRGKGMTKACGESLKSIPAALA